MSRLVAEFRAIPWTARGRRIGRTIELTVGTVVLVFGPALTVGLVEWVLP